MADFLTLADLAPGDEGFITSFAAHASHLRRFREMGLMAGTPFKVLRYAPLGDPIEISVRGSLLSIRGEEGSLIRVEKKQATQSHD